MKIGFIGLGIMGKAMSKNLLKEGYALVVLDRNTESVEEVVAAGAERATAPKAFAEQREVSITMLPNSPHVKELVLGENGVIEGVKAGSVVIDMSSIAPLASRKIAAAPTAKQIQMLDAPVSGGDKGIFERHVDMLKSMAGSVVHTGDIGAGNITKLANQVIVALNITACRKRWCLPPRPAWIRNWCIKQSAAVWPAAPCWMPRRRWCWTAISNPVSVLICTSRSWPMCLMCPMAWVHNCC